MNEWIESIHGRLSIDFGKCQHFTRRKAAFPVLCVEPGGDVVRLEMPICSHICTQPAHVPFHSSCTERKREKKKEMWNLAFFSGSGNAYKCPLQSHLHRCDTICMSAVAICPVVAQTHRKRRCSWSPIPFPDAQTAVPSRNRICEAQDRIRNFQKFAI